MGHATAEGRLTAGWPDHKPADSGEIITEKHRTGHLCMHTRTAENPEERTWPLAVGGGGDAQNGYVIASDGGRHRGRGRPRSGDGSPDSRWESL